MTHDGLARIDLCPSGEAAIAALRKREPTVKIEIRWCPANKGVPGNEAADGWAKLAASELDDHGVEWLAFADGTRIRDKRGID